MPLFHAQRKALFDIDEAIRRHLHCRAEIDVLIPRLLAQDLELAAAVDMLLELRQAETGRVLRVNGRRP